MTDVRPATGADVETVLDTVVAAFADDPAWTFITGPGNLTARRAFALGLLIPRLERGTVWVADGGRAAAIWERRPADPPADPPADAADRWAAFRAETGDEVWKRLSAYDEAVGALAPSRPYWYLGVLATHPQVQGRGLATAVLRPGFEAAAGEGWDCWLETSVPANKAFYAGRGFTEVSQVEGPGVPPTWWMRRGPA